MENTRPSQEIVIGNTTYVVKTYATAREVNAIQGALFKANKIEVVGEDPKIANFDPTSLFEMHQETVRQMVTKMGDSSDNIVERCLDLPSEEFDELIAVLDPLISKKKK